MSCYAMILDAMFSIHRRSDNMIELVTTVIDSNKS